MARMEAGNGGSGQAVSAGPRSKRPARPDNKESRRQTEKLTAEINRYAERIKEIKSVLENRRKSGPQTGSKEHGLTRKLDELRADFQRNVVSGKKKGELMIWYGMGEWSGVELSWVSWWWCRNRSSRCGRR